MRRVASLCLFVVQASRKYWRRVNAPIRPQKSSGVYHYLRFRRPCRSGIEALGIELSQSEIHTRYTRERIQCAFCMHSMPQTISAGRQRATAASGIFSVTNSRFSWKKLLMVLWRRDISTAYFATCLLTISATWKFIVRNFFPIWY